MDETLVPDGGAALQGLIARAQALGEEEHWDEAYALLAEHHSEYHDDALYLCWLGLTAERAGADGEAYDAFRRCLALEPQDPFVLAAAGSGVAAYDDPAAERALRLAALTAPEFPFARSAYGAYLAREGLLPEAIAELEAARNLAPDDISVRTELAIAHLLAGHPEEGVAELESALSDSVDDSWVRALLGLGLVEAGRMEEAAETLHLAAAERVDDVEVQLLAALALAGRGWEDEANHALARAEAAAEAMDRELMEEVEERIEAGPEAADAFLRDDLGPTLLRERLLQRA